jgi:ABC-type transporter Mla MlaB component
MLRITVHRNPQSTTFQLEGRLSRPGLQELEKCWRRTLISKDNPAVRVDLTGVTFVDDAGKACLAAMYHEGADFVANDCLTKSIVEEITNASIRRLRPFETNGRKQDNAKTRAIDSL